MNLKKWRDVWERFSGEGVYPHELAFVLDNPLRNLILPAGGLAERLHLSPDSRVLEIGPGPGYFSAEVARRIPQGGLVLLDIQREMLTKARTKLVRNGHSNFRLVQGDATKLPFAGGTFDVVFLVTVLGEVPKPASCVASISAILKPGGMLSITEQAGDPDALTEPELQRMAEKHGFRCQESTRFRGGFTLNLTKG